MPPNTLQSLARWLAAALPPTGSFGLDETEALLNALGWSAPPGGADLGLDALDAERVLRKLAQLDLQVSAGTDDSPIALQIQGELLVEVLDFFNRARDFADGLQARLAGAGTYAAQTDIVAQLLPRFIDYMVIKTVELRTPTLYQILVVTGIFRVEPKAPDPAIFQVSHLRYAIDFGRLSVALTDPVRIFRELYGWGTPQLQLARLVAAIGALLQLFGLPAQAGLLPRRVEERLLGRAVPEADADPLPRVMVHLLRDVDWGGLEAGLAVYGLRPSAPSGADGGIAFSPFARGATSEEVAFQLSEQVSLEIDAKAAIEAGLALMVRQDGQVQLKGGILGGGALQDLAESVSLRLVVRPGGDSPFVLIALPGGSRLELEALALCSGGRPGGGGAEFFVEVELRRARFILDVSGAGGAITALVPKDAVRADLDLAIGWSGGKAYLRGGAALEATFPVRLSLGPVELQTIVVGLAPGAGGELSIEVSATVQATLGPLIMLIERIGLTAAFDFKGGGGGTLGPLDIDLKLKPPNGIGLSLDAGPISGGGYLSVDSAVNRYAGVLQLKLTAFSLVAYGIYEEVAGQVSFVAVIGVRFTPGIQLGFGFALTGVGGLVGLNRRANVDLLRERLSSGAAGNVLFCEDPVKNAPAILGDLGAFFPASAGGFLVGPTVQIGWLAPIVRIDLGILIELPGPSKIIILGSFRAMIGLSETIALLYLRMDVLGIIDFEKQLISIDAALVNSHALGVFRLTGGIAFRLAYGSNPYFLLSIGGFHPRFDPGPLSIPKVARVGASLDISVVVSIYVRLELYVAFTSNTLQAGAKVEAGLEIGPLSAHGYFQFDALIQFRPFHFELDFAAGFAVEVFDVSFCSVDIAGSISGPGPIVIHARGSVKVLFVRVSASATFELGDNNADRPAPIASPVRELAPELRLTTNLRTEGDDPAIVLRPGRPAVPGVLVSPKGSLIWEQKRAPLNTIIHRLGGVPLAGQHELRLDHPAGWMVSDERDWFNPGSFTNLDLQASQTLNNATFQELPSGLRVGSQVDVQAGTVVEYLDAINLIKRPEQTRFGNLSVGTYLNGPLHSAMRDRTTTPAVDAGPAKVSVKPETADVHAADGAVLHAGETPFQAFQLSRQQVGRVAVPSSDLAVNL